MEQQELTEVKVLAQDHVILSVGAVTEPRSIRVQIMLQEASSEALPSLSHLRLVSVS